MQTHIVVSQKLIHALNVVQIRRLVIKKIAVIRVTLEVTLARLLLQQTRTTVIQERIVRTVQLGNMDRLPGFVHTAQLTHMHGRQGTHSVPHALTDNTQTPDLPHAHIALLDGRV